MRKIFTLLVAILLSLFYYSCNKDVSSNPIGNQPPYTGLFLYPDSTISKQPSKIHLHWWGDDPDGFVEGYYFSWDGKNWTFTTSNDSLFALKIGAKDTAYTFSVAAVDNEGNGVYDNDIYQNGIHFGPEPFVDLNNNGKWDSGEPFTDIGLIDPSPATQKFPIKNSPPTIQWNSLSLVSKSTFTSFPAMTFGWDASDIDGDETIQQINIALNDTTDPSHFVILDGSVRNVAIRTTDFTNSSPMMDVLIEGSESNIASQKLPGLKFNDYNKFYVQAEDISGAKSKFISWPDSTQKWYVKKPSGKLLIVRDYSLQDNSASFYESEFDSLGLAGKYDEYDLVQNPYPYPNITFLQTMKLFKYIFWYTDNNPSLDLASALTQNYLDAGGKIAFSMQFPQSFDVSQLQNFLPIIPDSTGFSLRVLGNVDVVSDTTSPQYPDLKTTSTAFRVRSFYLTQLGALPIYYYKNGDLPGYTGFMDEQKDVFFISLPLHIMDGNGTVKTLLDKVFIQDFGLTL